MCVGLHVKFILHYQLAQRPDQAPAACLPKITCELVFIGTPAGCCHSVHLPASWEDCHWLTATVLDGQYHPSQTQQQSEPGTAHHHHHHPTLMPSCPWRKRQKRGSGSTHPLQKMPGLSQGGATTGEFKCVSQNQQYEIWKTTGRTREWMILPINSINNIDYTLPVSGTKDKDTNLSWIDSNRHSQTWTAFGPLPSSYRIARGCSECSLPSDSPLWRSAKYKYGYRIPFFRLHILLTPFHIKKGSQALKQLLRTSLNHDIR